MEARIERARSQDGTSEQTDDEGDVFAWGSDKPREECGVVGIFGDSEASRLCYLALHALQHRGQEGAGIVVCNEEGQMRSTTGMGLVSEVFDNKKMEELEGTSAVGHVRYATAGASVLKNVQVNTTTVDASPHFLAPMPSILQFLYFLSL